MKFKHPFLWISGIIVLTALALLVGWEEIKGVIQQANLYVLFLLCLLQVGTLALTAYIWHYLLGKRAPGYPFTRVFAMYLGGNFVESVTPAAKLGGEAARVYLFRQLTSLPYTKISGVLLAHKYISLLPFVILCALMLALSVSSFELPLFFVASFVALLALFAAVAMLMRGRRRVPAQPDREHSSTLKEGGRRHKWQRVVTFLETSAAEARSLATKREQLALFAISLCVWALYPVKVYLVTLMLGLEVNFLIVAMATYSAYMVSMIPLLPGGLGTFEGSMALIFALSGLSPAAGLAVAFLTRLVTYWFSLLFSACAAATLVLGKKTLSGGACRPGSLLRGSPQTIK